MKYEAFKRRILNNEQCAAANPVTYRVRVATFVVLGYAFVFFLASFFLILILLSAYSMLHAGRVHSGAVKLIVFFGVIEFFLLKALMVKAEPPDGEEITAAEFPLLFQAIEELRRRLNCRKIHHVLLDAQLNACVSQVPRYGFFGGSRNDLVIGLELMSVLTPDELKAVLAHELGHISGDHSRFACRMYRIMETWRRINENLDGGWISTIVIRPFLKWYMPRLDAYTFVLSRHNEVEADLRAAEIAGCDHAASALVAIDVCGFREEQLRERLFERSREIEEPDFGYTTIICRQLNAPQSDEDIRAALHQALTVRTDITDTHPCLSERLALLQYQDADLPALYRGRAPVRAAEHFLGDAAARLREEFDSRWLLHARDFWKESHREARKAAEKLAEFEQAHAENHLDSKEKLEGYADLLLKNGRKADAIAAYSSLTEKFPDQHFYAFDAGTLMLNENDERGLPLLRRAIEGDKLLLEEGIGRIVSYLYRHGRNEEIALWHAFREEHQKSAQKLATAVSQFDASACYLPHDLSAEEVAGLHAALTAFPVKKAYLVKKDMSGDGTEIKVCLLAIKTAWWRLTSSDLPQQIANALPSCNSIIYVQSLNALPSALEKKIRRVPGALVYPG